MDETDFALMNLLFEDSRTPYSALADRLKMSVPAVYKRVTALHESGVITKFTANLSVAFLKAVRVYLSGISEIFPMASAVENLGKDDRTEIVVTSSGNTVGVRGILPTIQDLDSYVAFCRKAAAVATPAIAIEGVAVYGSSPPHPAPRAAVEPDVTDYRIVQALHDDARKPVADLCEELHLSPKTVRNRLRRLTEGGVVEFSLQAQPGAQAGVHAYLAILVKPDVDVSAFRGRLISDLSPRIVWSVTAGNVPNGLTVQSWSPTLVSHEELVSRVNAYQGVERVLSIFISHYDFPETWRDRLLEKRARDTSRS